MSVPWAPSSELETLSAAICAGELTAEGRAQLEVLLRDEPACRWYRDFCLLQAELRFLVRAGRASATAGRSVRREAAIHASSVVTQFSASGDPLPLAPGAPDPGLGFFSTILHGTIGCFPEGMPVAYLIATVVTGLGLLIGSHIYMSRPEEVARQYVPLPSPLSPLPSVVGRITGKVDCNWETKGLGIRDWGLEKGSGFGGQGTGAESHRSSTCQSLIPNPQSLVSLGDRFALASGLMEITYDTGAKVILQGPVTYQVEANGGYLAVGKLTGKLETKNDECRMMNDELWAQLSDIHPSSFILHPFVVRTPTATVTDLGTEFGVEVTENQQSQLRVFQGRVVIQTRGSDGIAPQTIELGKDEAVSVQPRGAVTRYAGSAAKSSAMATSFVREIPKRVDRTTNPIDATPGLLYHLDAAHGVVRNARGGVTDWTDRSKNRYAFRGKIENTSVALVTSEPSFGGRPVLRNTSSTDINLLRLWVATTPRSVIIVEKTTSGDATGGIWGYSDDCGMEFGIRRDALHNWMNANSNDWAFDGRLYVNGVATFIQPNDAPGILEAYNANPTVPVFYRTSLFGYSRVDRHPHPVRWWQGDIAEVAAFDRVLTEAERASIVGHLGTKYRIATLFNPSIHKDSASCLGKSPSASSAAKEK